MKYKNEMLTRYFGFTVLLPWHMVAVQVRARFEDLTTRAKTRILPVHGHEIGKREKINSYGCSVLDIV